jgi:hypothetical protein
LEVQREESLEGNHMEDSYNRSWHLTPTTFRLGNSILDVIGTQNLLEETSSRTSAS